MKKNEFISMCNKARNLEIQIEKILQSIFEGIDEEVLNRSTDAENSNNIEEAINCYIQYGEYSPEKIWEEMQSEKM